MYKTFFYKKADGTEPALDFLLQLDFKMRAKMISSLTLLHNNGPALRMPYSEDMGDGIFALRAIQGNNITRMFFFYDDGKIVILTHGIVKKTQKTPPDELERAKRYRSDYLKRKDEINEDD